MPLSLTSIAPSLRVPRPLDDDDTFLENGDDAATNGHEGKPAHHIDMQLGTLAKHHNQEDLKLLILIQQELVQ